MRSQSGRRNPQLLKHPEPVAMPAVLHNLAILDPDGPLRHVVPFVRTGARALPLLGAAAAMRMFGIPPSDVHLDGTTLRVGEASFIHLWQYKDGAWKITRVISYDHHAAAK